jgi:hypothetical protein
MSNEVVVPQPVVVEPVFLFVFRYQ